MYKRAIVDILLDRLNEKRRYIQVLVGPRQVGKTTAINQIEVELKKRKDLLVVVDSADDRAIAGRDWINRVWEDLRAKMVLQKTCEAILILDEIQKAQGWSEAVKRNWEQDTHDKRVIKVLLSGSSRMLIQDGLSESLFGRYEQHYLAHWSFCEIKEAFGLTPQQYAFYGAYPGLAEIINDANRFKSMVTNSVVEASLNRDILLLTKIDKPALLRQLFELGIHYSGQIFSYNKMLGQLQDVGNTTTLARYLHLLDQAGLLAGIEKYSAQKARSRASSPKYQVYNNALLAASTTHSFEDVLASSMAWGRIVESAVGAHLLNETRGKTNTQLFYWNRDNSEVDFVLVQGNKTLAIEVKSQTFGSEARGLRAFQAEFPVAKTLLVGQTISWIEILGCSLEEILHIH